METITPEEALRQFTAWKERCREANRKYRQTHAEQIKKHRAEFYEANKEEVRRRNVEYKRLQRLRQKEKKEEDKVNERTDGLDQRHPNGEV